MGADLLGISTSGLLVAQQQISTTGHNIANVNTKGYARQNTTSVSRVPGFTGNGYVGTGVEIEATKRHYNEFLEELIRSSNSQLGKQEQFYNISSQIDDVLGDPDAGLTPTLEAFYNAMQEVNDYPSSVPARSVLLTSAQTLVDRFDFLQDRLINLNAQVNDNLKSVTTEVTSAATSLAELNARIIYQVGNGQGSTPNDVLDQREELIKTISEKVDVNIVYQDNGAVNLFIGSGQALVLDTTAFKMEVVDSEYSPKDQRIYLSNQNGSFDISTQIRGGELQGLLDVKTQVLESGFNALGRIAAGVSKETNEQHELGMTLQPNGSGGFNMGSNFFNDLDESQLAYRSKLNSDDDNISFKITDTNVLTTSDYELIKIDATTFNIKRLKDNLTLTGTSIADLNTKLVSNNSAVTLFGVSQGFQIDVPTPTLEDGDKFLLQPTHELARSIALKVDDVKDIAIASPMIVTENQDVFGVGQNTGSGTLEFIQFSPTNVKQDLSGNLVDSSGATVDVPLTGTGEIIFSNYNTGTNAGLNRFTVTLPDSSTTTLDYNPSTQSGLELSLPGAYSFMKVSFKGLPAAGDTFSIKNNTTPQDDNRNGLIMAQIQSKKTLENGRADFQRAYGLVVADIGTRTHSSEIDLRAQVTINDRAQQNRNSVSGVNLDEEASSLLRFQQSFQASAKVIGVADEVFNTLLQSVR